MAWMWLLLAGICEVVWAAGLKKWGVKPTTGGAFTIVVMILSFVLLDRAMRNLPLGTAYPIWTGIGAVGTAVLGIFYFGEPRDWPRLVCIAMVVCGIVGLKMLTPTAA